MEGRRQSPLVLGSLFTSGATWVTLSFIDPAVRSDSRSLLMVVLAIIAAYGVGVPLMIAHRWAMPGWLAYTITIFGTIASTMVVVGGPPTLAGAHGGFYGYVAAYSFLYFRVRLAVVQWAVSGTVLGLALTFFPVPHPLAHWITVMGIAAGGAGLLGLMASRLREQWVIERAANEREAELVTLRSTFLRAISHELRTPLTSVLGFAKTLESHGSAMDAETVHTLHTRIRVRAERLTSLLDDLLDLDRLQRGGATANRQPVLIGDVLANALAQIDRPHHMVRTTCPVDEPIDVEAALIERILVNLIANAVRHTPPGTSVDVSCRLDDAMLVIETGDDGPGIPEALHEALFSPFVQGDDAPDRASPGTGIGLALVRQMAELHGGTARVTNRPTHGALFRVEIPDVLMPAAIDAEITSTADHPA